MLLVLAVREHTPGSGEAGSRFRPDVQALRAIAVLLVVVYHFWPDAVPGGYAGVDVFFVISGYLITAHLAREYEATGKLRLWQFWARRARRLLPAALFVALVTAAAVLVIVPRTFWQQFFREIGAAVAYVLNWQLAQDAVDYLAAENNPSPVQHYWSLSAEEQFYVVWPFVVLASGLLARRLGSTRRALLVVLGAVTAASLVVSVLLTWKDPARAYFVTPTRAWEFGVGGLVALLAVDRARRQSLVAWAGVAALLATGLLYSGGTPFPGIAALLPVAGTAAVIWSGGTSPVSVFDRIASARPVQAIGDVSYSLYLWHWPLIVIPSYLAVQPLGDAVRVGLLAAAFVLAWATKRWIEDPVRRAAVLRARRPRFTFAAVVVGMFVVLVMPAGGYLAARSDIIKSQQEVDHYIAAAGSCLGAGAMVHEGCADEQLRGVLLPTLAAVKADAGGAYDCSDSTPSAPLHPCTIGSTRPDAKRVALQGDSHAAMLIPALRDQLERLNWRLDIYVGQGCSWSAVHRTPGVEYPPSAITDADCAGYRTALQRRFLQGPKYDAILFTAWRGPQTTQAAARNIGRDRARVWRPVAARGTRIVALLDNPTIPDGLTDCAIKRVTLKKSSSACTFPRARGERSGDSIVTAVAETPGAKAVSADDLYCRKGACPMVIGHVVVYRDKHHLTATYARTVGPYVARRLAAAMAQ